jgi:hypothetical protein
MKGTSSMATLTLGTDQKAVLAAKKAFDEKYSYLMHVGIDKGIAYELAKIAGKKAYDEIDG